MEAGDSRFMSYHDIAARAGGGRTTVYRHFPSEEELLAACGGRYFAGHPLPHVWRQDADLAPAARLRSPSATGPVVA
ncbi:TetR/AcrR family transcriptional regulator [Nonomuraea sp. NPDC050451]|uniref:TetR/AcrR family transcriptional regulator n=1 Tax=Nonomuraea sp. NPDC050451 TaxID=3364364 RepID=UPI00379725E8